jgi:hypothetical protein
MNASRLDWGQEELHQREAQAQTPPLAYGVGLEPLRPKPCCKDLFQLHCYQLSLTMMLAWQVAAVCGVGNDPLGIPVCGCALNRHLATVYPKTRQWTYRVRLSSQSATPGVCEGRIVQFTSRKHMPGAKFTSSTASSHALNHCIQETAHLPPTSSLSSDRPKALTKP